MMDAVNYTNGIWSFTSDFKDTADFLAHKFINYKIMCT